MGNYLKTTTFVIALSAAGLSAAWSAEPCSILDAINQAVKTHPGVGEAAADRRATEAELRQSQGTLLPQIRLQADAGPEMLNQHDLPANFNNNGVYLNGREASVVVHQIVFDGQMTLVNEGSIIATGSNALVIDTGANTIVNTGTLEATGSGGLAVHSGVANDGVLWANGGNVTLDGDVSGSGSARISGTASLEIGGAFNERIVFDDGAAGTLKLDHSADFSGILTGFGGNDVLDLSGILGASATLSYTENAQGTGGTLSVTDGTHTANIAFTGQYTASDFHVAADPGYSAGNHALVQLEHQAQQLAAAA